MSQGKDIIFYSNFCRYSKDLLDYITKKEISNHFVFVCVDKHRQSIPNNIDRVPALYITTHKKVLFEDDIIRCIDSSLEQVIPLEQPSSAFSDNFSFIEDDQMMPNSLITAKKFATFGDEQRIHWVADENAKTDSENTLEKYTSQREHDIAKILGQRRTMV